jgi:hypothetical protein
MIRLTLYFACTNCDAQTLDPKDVRKRPFIGPLSKWILRAATTGVLVGVYQFNTNDIGTQHSLVHHFFLIVRCLGLTELITHIWTA